MSRTVLEQVLELKINEEHEAAEELLHNFIVENAREILADMLGIKSQVLSNWKTHRQPTPKWARTMLILLELSDLPATEFIRKRS